MRNIDVELIKNRARRGDEASLLQAEEMLLNHLKIKKNDTNCWLLLSIIEWNAPLEDPDRIIEYLKNIFMYDPYNHLALLILSQTYHTFLGGINKQILDILLSIKSADSEINAMIELAKARYFKNKDREKYQEALAQSIRYSHQQQINCTELATLYAQQGHLRLAKEFFELGIANVKQVNMKWDEASLECWFDYYYKGIRVTQLQYNDLKTMLNNCVDNK